MIVRQKLKLKNQAHHHNKAHRAQIERAKRIRRNEVEKFHDDINYF